MKSMLAFGSALLALAISLPAAAGPTRVLDYASYEAATTDRVVFDFEDQSPGNGVFEGDEYAASGLQVSHADGAPMNILQVDGFFLPQSFVNSGTRALSAAGRLNANSNNGIRDNFLFDFDTAVSAAGLWIGSVGPAITTIEFVDALGGVLDSIALDPFSAGPFGDRTFVGLVDDAASISGIRTFNGANDADSILFDDIQFARSLTAPVPAPSALLLVALAGFGAIRRGVR